MRNLLALVGLAVIGFAGAGWYLGWYKLSYSRTTDGNIQINTTVDTNKVGTDASDGWKNVTTAIGNQADKTAQDVKTAAPAAAPGGTPGPNVPPQMSPNPTVPGTLPTTPAAPGPIQLKAPK